MLNLVRSVWAIFKWQICVLFYRAALHGSPLFRLILCTAETAESVQLHIITSHQAENKDLINKLTGGECNWRDHTDSICAHKHTHAYTQFLFKSALFPVLSQVGRGPKNILLETAVAERLQARGPYCHETNSVEVFVPGISCISTALLA